MDICAILLAAGSGSRFGGDKLLHPLADGTPIGVQAARNLLAAAPDVIAVVRPGDFRLLTCLSRKAATSRSARMRRAAWARALRTAWPRGAAPAAG